MPCHILRRQLLGSERLCQPNRSRAGCERPLLALVWRPSRQGYDLECSGYSAVGKPEALLIEGERAQERDTAQWALAPSLERIGCSHGAQLPHQGQRVGIGYRYGVG